MFKNRRPVVPGRFIVKVVQNLLPLAPLAPEVMHVTWIEWFPCVKMRVTWRDACHLMSCMLCNGCNPCEVIRGRKDHRTNYSINNPFSFDLNQMKAGRDFWSTELGLNLWVVFTSSQNSCVKTYVILLTPTLNIVQDVFCLFVYWSVTASFYGSIVEVIRLWFNKL